MDKWSCDFETINDINDCRIWAWGAYNIDTQNFIWGTNLDEFLEFLIKGESKTVYFHNAAFDCEFLMTHLFRRGYSHRRNDSKLLSKEFKTLISDDGLFYTMKIRHTSNCTTTIYDSLKIIPLKVAAIPKAFGLTALKGDIEYNKDRPFGYIPDENELKYLENDCKIVGQALKIMFGEGLVKMTQASNALNFYKQMIGNKMFNHWYPNIDDSYDFIKASYKGGFVYLNPRYRNKEIYGGEVYDVNSLYPAMMLKPLPWGEPKFFYGCYQDDPDYPLYIQGLFCSFELKEGYLPTIQLKHNYRFSDTEYLKSSDGEVVYLVLTSVDLKLFFDHYEVYNIDYAGGYMYHQSDMLFRQYVEYWNSVKVESALNGNKGMRQIAKLMLNSLYGKFGTNPKANVKWPTWDEEENRIRYIVGELPPRKTLYLPVASFITSYARDWTIRSAQKCKERFIYADTDSLHIVGHDPIDLDIDDVRLGAWKNESTFSKGKYLRAKCYIEYGHEHGKTEDELKVTVAGLPATCYSQVTFENFQYGQIYTGKLQQHRVSGGIVLSDTTFEIKPLTNELESGTIKLG